MRNLCIFGLLSLSVACGDDDDAVDDSGDSGGEGYAGEGVPWPDKTADERQAYMQAVVLPDMQAEFENHDSSYATMNCATCHGSGASSNFAMPNPDLPVLDPKDWPTGATATFMNDTVVPTMANLLDADPFDPKTGQGFGCYGCHTGP